VFRVCHGVGTDRGGLLFRQNLTSIAVLDGPHARPAFGSHGRRLFDKPIGDGGLNDSRPLVSAIIAVFIVICIAVFPQRPGAHSTSMNKV
jgi:hypothetical protein